jgi:hypothetical protein
VPSKALPSPMQRRARRRRAADSPERSPTRDVNIVWRPGAVRVLIYRLCISGERVQSTLAIHGTGAAAAEFPENL